jgi:flavin reductase (DIM6/NTAB) family NADH-FMN oxidoreductase RutF
MGMPKPTPSKSLVPVDAARFKAAMRCIASTVTVITSGSGALSNGMTATAICSVSAEPPCILVVINQSNRSHASIERAGTFAVNVLSEQQVSLAQHFASKADAPLERVDYHPGVTGAPILDGCVAHLECVVESRMTSGTHSVFVARVVSTHDRDALPLLYHNGNFAALHGRSA